jgi:hypothetical protein
MGWFRKGSNCFDSLCLEFKIDMLETTNLGSPAQSLLLPLLVALEQYPSYFSDEDLAQVKGFLQAFPKSSWALSSLFTESSQAKDVVSSLLADLGNIAALADRSEDDLIASINRKIAEVAFLRLVGDSKLWAKGHHLPPDYRFNREEVYN